MVSSLPPWGSIWTSFIVSLHWSPIIQVTKLLFLSSSVQIAGLGGGRSGFATFRGHFGSSPGGPFFGRLIGERECKIAQRSGTASLGHLAESNSSSPSKDPGDAPDTTLLQRSYADQAWWRGREIGSSQAPQVETAGCIFAQYALGTRQQSTRFA